MDMLGGSEATAFFAEQQSQALQTLQDFHAQLMKLEKLGLRRWEDLTRQARLGFYISMAMSASLFLVGVIIVIWGLVLLTDSRELSQQIGGGLLSALAALATTFSGRFWKDPVEHIQRFSAQQMRLQAAFIGFMNRIAQLRLVFERHYETGTVSPEYLEQYQNQLKEATVQAWQQMGEQGS